MEMFCDECGGLLVNEDGVLKCSSCGKVFSKDVKLSAEVKTKSKILKDAESPMEIVDAKCKKCGNDKAYVWVVQTRSADEAPTRFYRCTKCGHTWRDYS
ncbi:transcription factor S [Nanoarchaeota archaeon]|nr:MAG: transcription factor S [Nanoarchaeota archaeon]